MKMRRLEIVRQIRRFGVYVYARVWRAYNRQFSRAYDASTPQS